MQEYDWIKAPHADQVVLANWGYHIRTRGALWASLGSRIDPLRKYQFVSTGYGKIARRDTREIKDRLAYGLAHIPQEDRTLYGLSSRFKVEHLSDQTAYGLYMMHFAPNHHVGEDIAAAFPFCMYETHLFTRLDNADRASIDSDLAQLQAEHQQSLIRPAELNPYLANALF